MLFRLLAGRHIDNGKTYAKGDEIESDVDLTAVFGDNKFERLVTGPSSDSTESTSPETRRTKKIDLGEDVSDQFDDTIDQGISVYKRQVGKKGNRKSYLYFVTDNDKNPNTPVNEVGLKKSQVQPFIDDLFENGDENQTRRRGIE